MNAITVHGFGPSNTIFDVAHISRDELVEGFLSEFGTNIFTGQLLDILLAETVRRYVVEDRSPPGAQDQTREFDLFEIAADLPLTVESSDVEEALGSFGDRSLVSFSIPELEKRASDGCFFLSQAGVERGLALLERYVPPVRYPLGRTVAESRNWTGLVRRQIDENNRDKIVSAIEKAILLVDQEVSENNRHSQAISYLKAALELVDAPTPPSRIIWNLIQRTAAVAGLSDIFLRIFGAISD